MDSFGTELNQLLVESLHQILKVEEQSIRALGIPLSINELHMIEAIAKGGDKGQNISQIAASLGISLSSVTVGVNRLKAKGYVLKKRCKVDARAVYATLTEEGNRMNDAHQHFHEKMIRSISRIFSEEERALLLKCIFSLNQFFQQKILAMEKLSHLMQETNKGEL